MKYLKYLLYFLLVLVLFFILKGVFTPSVTYENVITVNKPVGEVWAVMSDESSLADWIEGFKKTEHISGTPNTIGAVSKIYVEENGKEMVMEETITAIKLNELIAMSFTMNFMDMEYEMLLEEKDGKTIVRTSSSTSGNGIMAKSIISFMPKSMKAQEDKNLNQLKSLIEQNTKNYFPEEALE